jgi:seryl-tRNA synthetase
MNYEEVKQKVESAKKSIEEIRKNRTQYQEALRQLELNEAGWLGFIEALTPYLASEEVPGD